MLLTPVKVRGKRRRKDEPALVPVPKRSMVERKKKPRKPRTPKASFMERELPLEVLERIFWFSENANLPRASPLFGRLLSGPSTLRKTFLNAFGPTWDVWFGCIRNTIHSYHGWQNDSARFGGNPEFQSSILDYPWANISLILDCWDLWVSLHAKNRHFEHIKIWRKTWGDPESPDTTSLVETSGSNQGARHHFLHDYDAFRRVETFGETDLAAMNEHDHHEQNPVTWIEVHPNTRIPDCLLTGPWDEAALQKLFWMVRAGARLSPDQTWELTLEGFHNALALYTTPTKGPPNLTVIRLFEMLRAFQTWPLYIVEEEYKKIDNILQPLDSRMESYYKHSYIQTLLGNYC